MEFEVGQRVRVLPGARSVSERSNEDFFPAVWGDKTGRVIEVFGDGDVGIKDGNSTPWFFAPEFLSALDKEGK